jgi:uncharacterized integral membrane protein
VLRRAVWLLVALPAAIALITLAVSNRQAVRLVLDPFRPDDPVLFLVLPLYAYLFAALIIGVLLGGAAAWFAQRRWRRMARRRTTEAVRWQAEADRLMREREHRLASPAQLAPARR